MPGQPSPDIVQIGLRVTKDLRRRLMAAAKASGRSLNAEINARIEQTFRRHSADAVLELAQKRERAARALYELAAEKSAEFLASDTMKILAESAPRRARRVKK